MSDSVVVKPWEILIVSNAVFSPIPAASRGGFFLWALEQAEPVETAKPAASKARTITSPGIPLNAALKM